MVNPRYLRETQEMYNKCYFNCINEYVQQKLIMTIPSWLIIEVRTAAAIVFN